MTLRFPSSPTTARARRSYPGCRARAAGPTSAATPSTSRRKPALVSSQRAAAGPGFAQCRCPSSANGQAAIAASCTPRSAVGRMMARTSYRVRSSSSASRQLLRLVGVAQARPGDQVGAGRDGRRRVELEERQVADDFQQVGGPVGIEELCPHCDASGFGLAETVHGHGGRLVCDVMSAIREGGCACGEIRYRLTSDPLFVHCCHCLNCQRQTGSAFVINLLIETDRVELLAGDPEPVAVPRGAGRSRRSGGARRARSRSSASTRLPRSGSFGAVRSTTPLRSYPTFTSTPGRSCPG